MTRETDIYLKLADLRKANCKAALCTVTGTFGSSPRKAGAKMIVTGDRQVY